MVYQAQNVETTNSSDQSHPCKLNVRNVIAMQGVSYVDKQLITVMAYR